MSKEETKEMLMRDQMDKKEGGVRGGNLRSYQVCRILSHVSRRHSIPRHPQCSGGSVRSRALVLHIINR